MATKKRKRAYRTHEFGQALSAALADVGDQGYVKVLLPDGLAMHRVVGLTPTLEDDVIVMLEATPCWRKRGSAQIEVPEAKLLWRPVPETGNIAHCVARDKIHAAVANRYNGVWYGMGMTGSGDLCFAPTHFAELPPLPEVGK